MNWLIFCTVLIFTCKSRKYIKAHNVVECLNKSSECLEELCYFFIMSDVEKRKAILVACCLNNLYGCYASLKTFVNFLIINFLFHPPSQNLPQRRANEIPRNFGFDQDRLAHGGIIFAPVRKSLRNGKKLPHVSRKFWIIMHWAETVHPEK